MNEEGDLATPIFVHIATSTAESRAVDRVPATGPCGVDTSASCSGAIDNTATTVTGTITRAGASAATTAVRHHNDRRVVGTSVVAATSSIVREYVIILPARHQAGQCGRADQDPLPFHGSSVFVMRASSLTTIHVVVARTVGVRFQRPEGSLPSITAIVARPGAAYAQHALSSRPAAHALRCERETNDRSLALYIRSSHGHAPINGPWKAAERAGRRPPPAFAAVAR